MTINAPLGDDGSSEDILLIAENHFGRMLRRADEVIAMLEKETTGVSKEAAACIRDLGKATQTAFGERATLEKLRKHNAGIVHRMARLRDAQDSAEVSE